jgi:glycine oxidase
MLVHPYGAAHVLKSGFLDTSKWLSLFKGHLIKAESFINSKFNYDDIELVDTGINWKGYHAKKIIFCEGYQTINNPYFEWLPFKLTKGETLTVKFENLEFKVQLMTGKILMKN